MHFPLILLVTVVSAQDWCPLRTENPIYYGFWPVPIDDDVSHAKTGEKLESSREVALRANTYFEAIRHEACIVNINHVLYAQMSLRDRDQMKENAPLAVNRDRGGEDIESVTNTEVWRYVFETTSEQVFKDIMTTNPEYVVSSGSIMLPELMLLCVAAMFAVSQTT